MLIASFDYVLRLPLAPLGVAQDSAQDVTVLFLQTNKKADTLSEATLKYRVRSRRVTMVRYLTSLLYLIRCGWSAAMPNFSFRYASYSV